MRPVDVTFAPAPWQVFLESRKTSDPVCAGRLLALLEGEEDSALEEAFQELQELSLTLSLEDLPPRGASGEAALRLKREEELARTGLEPGKLEPSDPLRLYLEEVAAVELREDAHLLAGKAARGDEAARLALTNEGLSRVVTLACEYTGFGVLLLDLIQEGSLGLWQGVAAYQAGDYEAHRDRWIRLSMAKAVLAQARADGVGQRMRTAMEDYRRQDHQLLSQLGRSPTLGELAEGLHLSEGETASVKKCLDDAMLLAMTANPPEPEEAEAEEDDQPIENTALFQLRQRIEELLSTLDETDSRLLTLRYGLEGGLPKSPEDTAVALGMTPQEVVAREAAALARLRQG